jgi:crotonobetainyl-CoA:carnitine CoA-transferase CaiB-like acyl-CoA transferase
VSPGGSCRLLRGADGWVAVNLARPDDRSLLPAWLESDAARFLPDPWAGVEAHCAERPVDELIERARLCGMPVAPVPAPAETAPAPHGVTSRGPECAPPRRLRVVDLSTLWAGPLCSQLLGLAGADVVKVESRARPDGARFGPPAFFALMNGCKRERTLDLHRPDDVGELDALLRGADVVVESARPRALRQLGIDAETIVAETPGLVWVSITGYGRESNAVAFGDDAACAAGLAAASGDLDAPLFCADAIADPLAGVHAARIAWETRQRGGGALLGVALCDVAAHAADGPVEEARVVRWGESWALETGHGRVPVAAPRARPPAC